MTMVSKGQKPNRFWSHDMQCSFTYIRGLYSSFVCFGTFGKSSLYDIDMVLCKTYCETDLEKSVYSSTISVSCYLSLIWKHYVTHIRHEFPPRFRGISGDYM